MKRIVLVLLLTMLFITGAALISPSYALDENLYLTGLIKSVDPLTGIAVVDVKNIGCAGTRSFRVDDVALLNDLQGEQISFFIDRSKCIDKDVHKIVLSRGWRK